ncbi:MAG: hypothetical protein EA401_09990 [Planctomycetota bacterium]|nr:MAG: hypothetical protein EA401_09990 [Planctomycetota bacterium]
MRLSTIFAPFTDTLQGAQKPASPAHVLPHSNIHQGSAMAKGSDPLLKELLSGSIAHNRRVSKAYLRDHRHTGRLVDQIRSRMQAIMWITGILGAAICCFLLANTIGRSLLGLEESLDHHRSYKDPAPSHERE